MKFLLFFLVLSSFVSCFNSNDTPEKALDNYIKTITKKNTPRSFYLNHTTGSLYKSISEMTDEEFESFKQLPKIAGINLKVITKICDPNKCTLTYVLSFSSGKDLEFSNEIKKIAILELEDEEWKISQVDNLKTFIEGKKELLISN